MYNNNYLKDIRKDLMEEKENTVGDTSNSKIAYISVKVNNTDATAMIDTGANISLIDKLEPVSYTHLDVYKRQISKSPLYPCQSGWKPQKLLSRKNKLPTPAPAFH